MKIIQITVTPETRESYAVLYALTDDGRVFMKINPVDTDTHWQEMELPEEIME